MLPPDYLEKVYAGVLGKLVGVYLGRPFEGWTHQRILDELGPIWFYVHDRVENNKNAPLVVTDDDVSGTFVFVRALQEHGVRADLSSEDIGKTWLNNIIEHRAVFWWGGNGVSTEHTAFLNLKKRQIPAPSSGAIQTNGQTVAEQIGAQIFIDAWARSPLVIHPWPCSSLSRPHVSAMMAKLFTRQSCWLPWKLRRSFPKMSTIC
ncbi:hypothetical protein VTN77DRAFT_6245 [Rasamsonia byssochlamydoides]|uniref:uncharacterized protein n=1 Tax=Rasamsonia byssochlamydoides TaxID=89139 RepID=UPI003742E447